METGQAFLFVDGVDEIGDVRVRSALRDAVLEAMARYPHCRWLLTSRWVGYGDVPFNHVVVDGLPSLRDRDMWDDDLKTALPSSWTLPTAELRYMAAVRRPTHRKIRRQLVSATGRAAGTRLTRIPRTGGRYSRQPGYLAVGPHSSSADHDGNDLIASGRFYRTDAGHSTSRSPKPT